jgi:hypothetical protein
MRNYCNLHTRSSLAGDLFPFLGDKHIPSNPVFSYTPLPLVAEPYVPHALPTFLPSLPLPLPNCLAFSMQSATY